MAKLVKITGTSLADVLNGSGLAEKIKGKHGADVINGGGGNDKIKGNDGNDLISAGGGNDTIDGGKGTDTAVYRGLYEQYRISFSRNGDLQGTVTDLAPNRDGTDSLKKVEFLLFQDAIYDVENDTVFILVQNHAPVVASPILDQSVPEDTPVLFAVPENTFTDPDGNTLTYSATLDGGGALPTWLGFDASTRTFSGTPPLDFNGALSVRVSASDGLASVSDAFTLTVTAVNDAPVAIDDAASSDEDTPIVIAVLANDTDAEGDTLTPVIVSGVAHGSLVLNPDGTIKYTPAPNHNGTDSFTYRVSDGTSLSNTATVSITIDPVNDAPFATNDGATTPEDTSVTINVLANDTDADGDALTLVQVMGANHGTATIVANQLQYTPALNFFGTELLSYQVSDGHGGTDTAGVVISVTKVNDAPTVAVSPVTRTVSETAPVQTITAAFLLSASGAADVDGDALKIVNPHLFGPDGNEVPLDALPPGVSVVFAADGSFVSLSFDPADFSFLPANASATVKLEFDVSDGHGGLAHDTAVITINGVNNPALIGNPNLHDVTEDMGVQPNGALTATGNIPVNDPDDGQNAFDTNTFTPGTLGALTLQMNGGYTYSVQNAFTQFLGANDSRVDHFNIHSIDGTSKTVDFTIHGTNDPVLIQRLIGNGSFEAIGAFVPPAGTLSPAGGSTIINAWTVTGAGIDYVRAGYQGSMPAHGGAFLDLSGSVAPLGVYAGGVSQTFATQPGARYLVQFAQSGNPDGPAVGGPVQTIRATAGAQSQDFAFDTSGHTWTNLGWVERQLTFTANAPSTTLSFASLDGGGDFIGPLLDDVRVSAIHSIVETVGTPQPTNPGVDLANNIAFADADVSDHHTVGSVFVAGSDPQIGTFSASLLNDTTNGTGGLVHWDFHVAAGAIEFLGADEHRLEMYRINIDDGHAGGANSTLFFDMVGTNDAPLIQGPASFTRSVSAPSGPTPILLTDVIGFSDVDFNDHHVANSIFNPIASGAGTPLGQLFATFVSDSTHGAAGVVQWDYVIDPSIVNSLPFGTSRTDAFDILVDDAHGGVAQAHVTINISGPGGPPGGGGNPAPAALPDTYFVGEAGTVQTVLSVAAPGVLANDFDTGPFTAELLSDPSHALFFSFDPDGSFMYLPQPFFVSYSTPGQQLVQSDSFQYRAFDGTSYSAPTTVTINVTPPPHVHVNTFAYDMQGSVDPSILPMAKFYDDLALGNPVFTPGIEAGLVDVPPQTGFTVTTSNGVTYTITGANLTYDPITHEPTGGTFSSLEIRNPVPGQSPLISIVGASTGVEPPWQAQAAQLAPALQAYASAGDSSGLDTIFQALRYDIIDSGAVANSVIVGGAFGDELRGAAGADTLYGGLGDDVLSGGASSFDVATGGPGADRFEFGGADGINEVITDFSGVVGGEHDVIDVRVFIGPGPSQVAHTFAQILAHTSQDGADTVIDYTGTLGVPEETVIRLQDFDMDDLRQEDFLLANFAPFAAMDNAITNEGVIALIDVLANDTDGDGDPLAITGVSQLPSDPPTLSTSTLFGATISVVGNQIEYNPTTSPVLSTLLPGMPFFDNFTYTIADGLGGFSTAQVNVQIFGV